MWERRPFELEFDDFELIRDKLPRWKHFLSGISMMAALTMPLVGIGHMTGKALVSRNSFLNIFAGFQLRACKIIQFCGRAGSTSLTFRRLCVDTLLLFSGYWMTARNRKSPVVSGNLNSL